MPHIVPYNHILTVFLCCCLSPSQEYELQDAVTLPYGIPRAWSKCLAHRCFIDDWEMSECMILGVTAWDGTRALCVPSNRSTTELAIPLSLVNTKLTFEMRF
jgi:hypothetical protein